MAKRFAAGWCMAVGVWLAGAACAGEIGLTWSSSSGAAGYKVHYGTSPGVYSKTVDVGNVTSTKVSGLTDCSTWYFAVSAYNAAGASEYSNEVGSWPRTTISALNPGAIKQGSQPTLSFDGANFDTSKEWEVVITPEPCVPDAGAPGGKRCYLYNVQKPTATCNRVQVVETVEPTAGSVRPAMVGTYQLSLRAKDGTRQTASKPFKVDINPARFDVNRSDDVTKDRLDGKDAVWMAKRFGVQEGGATYDPGFDFDGDGWIDGDDLAHLASNLGGCWTGSAWNMNACTANLQ